MSVALPLAILGLLFAATAGLAYYFANQELKLALALHEFAGQRGWSFRRHPANRRAYQMSGGQGEVNWQLAIYRSARNQLPYTLWESSSASLVGGPILIGSGLAQLVTPIDNAESQDRLHRLGAGIFFRPAGWGIFSLPDDFGLGIDLDGLDVQPAGSPALKEYYDVLGRVSETVCHVLTPLVESQLLDWPASQTLAALPLVTVDAQGVSIRLPNDLAAEQPELLDRVVKLGLAVCEAIATTDPEGLE